MNIEHPEFLNEVCIAVASGGSLIELCKLWEIRYPQVIRWIYGDEGKKQAYEQAIKDRGEFFVQQVLLELRRMGTLDIRQAYDESGALKDVKDIPEDVARAIVAIETVELTDKDGLKYGEVKRVKFTDKIRSLELLGKNMSMFVDKVQHEHKGLTLEELVSGSWPKPVELPAASNDVGSNVSSDVKQIEAAEL